MSDQQVTAENGSMTAGRDINDKRKIKLGSGDYYDHCSISYAIDDDTKEQITQILNILENKLDNYEFNEDIARIIERIVESKLEACLLDTKGVLQAQFAEGEKVMTKVVKDNIANLSNSLDERFNEILQTLEKNKADEQALEKELTEMQSKLLLQSSQSIVMLGSIQETLNEVRDYSGKTYGEVLGLKFKFDKIENMLFQIQQEAKNNFNELRDEMKSLFLNEVADLKEFFVNNALSEKMLSNVYYDLRNASEDKDKQKILQDAYSQIKLLTSVKTDTKRILDIVTSIRNDVKQQYYKVADCPACGVSGSMKYYCKICGNKEIMSKGNNDFVNRTDVGILSEGKVLVAHTTSNDGQLLIDRMMEDDEEARGKVKTILFDNSVKKIKIQGRRSIKACFPNLKRVAFQTLNSQNSDGYKLGKNIFSGEASKVDFLGAKYVERINKGCFNNACCEPYQRKDFLLERGFSVDLSSEEKVKRIFGEE